MYNYINECLAGWLLCIQMTVICSYFNSAFSIKKVGMFPQQLVCFDTLETIRNKKK